MDLHRLKTYVSERINESKRLEDWAAHNGHYALAAGHDYSQMVGKQILKEIEDEQNGTP